MGSIYRGGKNFSQNGPGMPATQVPFAAETSGLKAKNVNAAILEVYGIVQNAVKQFTAHTYTYPTGANDQSVEDFLKDALKTASQKPGGFNLLDITKDNKHYIGVTSTVGSKCSFTLHSVENPANIFYGYFDNMNSAGGVKIYKVTGTETTLTDGITF